MRNETRTRNLISFLGTFFSSVEPSKAQGSASLSRSLHLEPLESRQLLSSVSLLADGTAAAIVSDGSSTLDNTSLGIISLDNLDNTENASVLENTELSVPLNASGSGLDMKRTSLNGGELNNVFQQVSYYRDTKRTTNNTYLDFPAQNKYVEGTLSISGNKAVNIVLQPTPGLLGCGIQSIQLLDSSEQVVSVAERVEQDGSILYCFPTFENASTQIDYTLRITRQATGSAQRCYYDVYENTIAAAGDFAEVEGSFPASSSSSVNSYMYSLPGNSSSSICVYAPQSHNLSVELYNSSGVKIAEAVNQGNGYYSIPCFVNSGSSKADYSIKLTGGGSGVVESYELTVSRDAAAATGAGTTLSNALDLMSFKKASLLPPVVFGSVNSTVSSLESTKTQISVPGSLSTSDYFGSSLAYDDGYMVVGTPYNSSGVISLYTPNLNDSGWSFLTNLSKPTSGLTSGDFGYSVDISGEWIVAGAPANNVNGKKIGSAFVYSTIQKTWKQLDVSAFVDDLSAGVAFGENVCIENDWLFVQAKQGSGDTSDVKTGVVYAYHLDSSGNWKYIQKLAGEIDVAGAFFGCALACDGQTLAVGAKGDNCYGTADGSVTIFTLSGDRWKQTQKIALTDVAGIDTDYVTAGMKDGIYFGCSVALCDGTLAIGAPGYGSGANGIVGVFQQNANNQWIASDTLFSNDKLVGDVVHTFDSFGVSLDLSKNLIAVGGNLQGGAVYMYKLNPGSVTGSQTGQTQGSWELTSVIDGENSIGSFASRVLIAGDRLVISDRPSLFSNNQSLYSFYELAKSDCYTFSLKSSAVSILVNPQNGATLNDFDIYFLDRYGNRLAATSSNGISYDSSKGLFQASISPSHWEQGQYYVCVRANNGCDGDYILEIKDGNPVIVTGESTNVVDGGYMNGLPGEIIFRFSDAINLENLSGASMTVGSRQVFLNSGNYRLIDGCTLAVSTPGGYTPDAGTLSIELTGLKDLKGRSVSTVSLAVTFDKSSPELSSSGSYISVDSGDGVALSTGSTTVVPQGETQTVIHLTFSEDMDFPATQARLESWIKITGENSGNIPFTATPQGPNALQIVITNVLSDDSYVLTLSENFTDKSGLSLSESSQTLLFAVNTDATMLMPTFQNILISGSRGYQSSIRGNISGTETDTFSFSLARGNTYSVYAIPTDSSLKLKMFDSEGSLENNKPGKYQGGICYSENIGVDADTTIEVSVRGVEGAAGNYTVLVVVNGTADILPAGVVSYASSSTVPGYNWSSDRDCSVYNFWGNVSAFGTTSEKQLSLTVGAKETLSLTLDPGTSSNAKVYVYSDSGRTQLLAMGRTDDSGLIIVDPMGPSTTVTTYYLQLTGLTSAYQLAAVKNGILNLESGSTGSENLQSGGRTFFVDGASKSSVYGSVAQLSGTITVDNMRLLSEASNGQTGTASSVAISDRWAVIGGVGSAAGECCVYVYELQGGVWVYVSTLTSSGQDALGFGRAVAIDGNYLAVSAPEAQKAAGSSGSGTSCGTVFLYQYADGNWKLASTITPSDAMSGMNFGASLALSDGQLAVGASAAMDSQNVCGSVYIYSITKTEKGSTIVATAVQTQKLLAGRTLSIGNRDSSVSIGYGSALDMDGEFLIVGSPSDLVDNTGSAFVYQYDGLRWNLISALSPSGSDGAALTSGAGFGSQVCLSGDYAAISAPYAGTTGCVYVYQLSRLVQQAFDQQVMVVPNVVQSQNASVREFGKSLAFADNQLLVGGFQMGTAYTPALWTYNLSSADLWSVGMSNYQFFDQGDIVVASSSVGSLVVNPETGKVYSYQMRGDSDAYTFTTKADGNLVYSCTGQGFRQSLGENDLIVSVYNSDGNLIVFTYDPVEKKYTSSESCSAGTYTAYINASSGKSGDYVFRVYSALDMEAADNYLKVESVLNGFDGFVQNKPDQIQVRFNSSLNLQTLSNAISAKQVMINGVVVSGYTPSQIDGTTVSFTIPSGAAANSNGEYVLTFNGSDNSASILKNTYGGGIGTDQRAVLTVDSTAVAPTIDPCWSATNGSADITLNLGSSPLRGVVDISQLELTGTAHGKIALKGTSIEKQAENWILTIRTEELPDDLYTLTLKTSEKAFADKAGNLINGGTSDFTITFESNWSAAETIQYDSSGTVASDFVKLGDESSISYQAHVGGYLNAAQTDSYQVAVPAGNSLLVLLSGDTRETTTLSFMRNGVKEDYSVIRTSSGVYAYLYNANNSTYQIEVVNSAASSSGGSRYSLDLYLNCQVELETVCSDGNNSLETAEDLSVLNYSVVVGKSLYQTELNGNLAQDSDQDWYKFTVNKDEPFNFYLNGNEGQSIRLELYNAAGTLIASGTSSAGWQQQILSFSETDTSAGFERYLRVSGSAGGYSLRVLRCLDITDIESENALGLNESAIGTLSGSQQDALSEGSFFPKAVLSVEELTRGAQYGSEVSVNGDLMIVGAPKNSTSGLNAGFAAIYRFSGSQWVQESVLSAPSGAINDLFGSAVDIQGSIAVVSAIGRVNGVSNGQAFVYTYSNGVWSYSDTLKNSGGADYVFGESVQILDENAILVSGTQEVLVFRKSYFSQSGQYVWTVGNSDRISAPTDYSAAGFGLAVDAYVTGAQTVLVVGAPESTNDGCAKAGLAFLYTNSGAEAAWELKSAFSLTDDSAMVSATCSNANFGQSVSIDGSWLAVGAPNYRPDGGDTEGLVYLYQLNNGSETYKQTLEGSSVNSGFGSSVSLSGNKLAIGSGAYNQMGAVNVYYNNGTTWTESQQIVSSGDKSANYGGTVVLAGSRLIVGASVQAYSETGSAVRSGAVYTYSLGQSNEYRIQVQANQTVTAAFNALDTPNNSLTGVKYQYRQADNASAEWIPVTGTSFTPNFSGACLVRLSGTSGSGEYAVTFSGLASSGALSAPIASIAAGSEISPFEGGLQIQFQFSEPIRSDRLGDTSIGIDGGLGITYPGSANWSLSAEGKTLTVNIPQQNKANFISNQMTLILDKDCFVSVSGKEYSSDVSFGYVVPIDTVKTLTQTTVAEDSVQVSVEFDSPMKLIGVENPNDDDWMDVVSVQYTDSDGKLQTVSAAALGATVEYVAETQSLSVELPRAGLAQLSANGACSVSLDALKVVAEDGTHLNNIESMVFGVPFVNSAAESLTVTIAVTTRDTVSNAPTDSLWVDEWSNVWVEIWGQANSGSGFGQVALRVANKGGLYNWAAENGSFVFEAGASFQGTNGSLTCQQDGEYLTLKGTTSVSGVGNGSPVLIGRIKCVPESGNTVTLSTMNDGQFPDLGVQVYGQGTAATSGGGLLNINVSNSSTKVVPVIYDLAENGSVDMSDFIKFAQSFNATATIGNESWYADFNRNGKVDMNDFIQFAQNFNASQAKGSRLSYSSDFISWMDSCVQTGAFPVAQASLSVLYEVPVAAEVTPVAISASDMAKSAPVLEATSENVSVLLDSSDQDVGGKASAVSNGGVEQGANVAQEVFNIPVKPVVLRSQRQAITGARAVSSTETGLITNLLFPITVTRTVQNALEFPQIAPLEAPTDPMINGFQEGLSGTEDLDWLNASVSGYELNLDKLSPTERVMEEVDWQWLNGKLEEDD